MPHMQRPVSILAFRCSTQSHTVVCDRVSGHSRLQCLLLDRELVCVLEFKPETPEVNIRTQNSGISAVQCSSGFRIEANPGLCFTQAMACVALHITANAYVSDHSSGNCLPRQILGSPLYALAVNCNMSNNLADFVLGSTLITGILTRLPH